MGLRCSVLGHDYGDTFVERDREERGNEVVVTERELQECSRCGAEKVTSENTEVRSIEPQSPESVGEESASESAAASNATPDTDAGASGSSPSSGTSGGSPSGGAFASATDAIEQAEAGMDSGTADTPESTADPGADDAVILDDSPDEEPGSEQWDEADVDPEPEPEPEPVEDDAEVVEAGPSDGATTTGGGSGEGATTAESERTDPGPVTAEDAATDPVDRGRGEWPDRDESDVDADATELEDDDQYVEADTGFTSAGPVDRSGTEDTVDFALYCPECGFEQPAAGASLRAGDICPECRKGYLAEDQ